MLDCFLYFISMTLLEAKPNESVSQERQKSSRKSLLARAIRAFRRGAVKQNFPTSQQKKKKIHTGRCCTMASSLLWRGDGASSWQHQTTWNWDLGGWLWATLEVPVKLLSGEEERERAVRGGERGALHVASTTPPRDLHYTVILQEGKVLCWTHNSADRSPHTQSAFAVTRETHVEGNLLLGDKSAVMFKIRFWSHLCHFRWTKFCLIEII